MIKLSMYSNLRGFDYEGDRFAKRGDRVEMLVMLPEVCEYSVPASVLFVAKCDGYDGLIASAELHLVEGCAGGYSCVVNFNTVGAGAVVGDDRSAPLFCELQFMGKDAEGEVWERSSRSWWMSLRGDLVDPADLPVEALAHYATTGYVDQVMVAGNEVVIEAARVADEAKGVAMDQAGLSAEEAKKAIDAAAEAKAAKVAAAGSASSASGSVSAAKTSESNAKASEAAAKQSEEAALGAKDSAETAASGASGSASAAKTSETNAKASESAAKQSESDALSAKASAETAASGASDSAAAAKTSEVNAVAASKLASEKASTATTKATEAASYSSTATAKATEAKASQIAANNSATVAATKANDAAASALGASNALNTLNSQKGQAYGVATLDATSRVPASQLPSYVDDVQEYSARANFPSTGETGKLYVATDSNKLYRWTGNTYIEVASAPIIVTDNLNSSSPTDALSANQGRLLSNSKLDNTHNSSSTSHSDLRQQMTSLVKSSVPIGGMAGQMLVKNSGANNDVKWGDVPTGGGGGIKAEYLDTIWDTDTKTIKIVGGVVSGTDLYIISLQEQDINFEKLSTINLDLFYIMNSLGGSSPKPVKISLSINGNTIDYSNLRVMAICGDGSYCKPVQLTNIATDLTGCSAFKVSMEFFCNASLHLADVNPRMISMIQTKDLLMDRDMYWDNLSWPDVLVIKPIRQQAYLYRIDLIDIESPNSHDGNKIKINVSALFDMLMIDGQSSTPIELQVSLTSGSSISYSSHKIVLVSRYGELELSSCYPPMEGGILSKATLVYVYNGYAQRSGWWFDTSYKN